MDPRPRKSMLVSAVLLSSLLATGFALSVSAQGMAKMTESNAKAAGDSMHGGDHNYAGVDMQFVRFDHRKFNPQVASVVRARVGRQFDMASRSHGKWLEKSRITSFAVEAQLGVGLDVVNDEPDEIYSESTVDSLGRNVTTNSEVVHAEMDVNLVLGLYGRANWVFNRNRTNVYLLGGYGKVDIDHDVGKNSDSFDNGGLSGGVGVQHTIRDNLGINVDVMGWDADNDYSLYSLSAGAVFKF